MQIDTGRAKPYELEITRHTVPITGLPPGLNGAVAVHLSDFHAGFGNTAPVLERVVELVDEICPHYLFLTGDYLDDAKHSSGFAIGDLIGRLHARIGAYGSLGNHDHRRGPEGTIRMLQ
ncbi:MAG TPA: metallophosphoesterase, partial [Chthonomonadales bacterium]|nr:metallophosphoesterase [Chthonomonadales bacterium]